MTKFNSREYEWADVSVVAGGRMITGIRGVSYTSSQEKEALYGKGNKVVRWYYDQDMTKADVLLTVGSSEAVITGNGSFTQEEVEKLARQINSGSLPFKLETSNFSTISPELGEGAKNAMKMNYLLVYV